MSANEFLEILRRLRDAGVEHVIVGGAAAVLHGSSMATYDLDVLMPFTRDNCERLLQAVSGVHPRLAHTLDRRPLQVSAEELTRYRNLYLLTDLGRLDVLGSLPPIADVQSVLAGAERMDVGGVEVSVIALDALIQVKHAMGRPKDRIVEAELRAIASTRRSGPGG